MNPETKRVLVTTTLVVVVFTVVVFGATMRSVVVWLDVALAPAKARSLCENVLPKVCVLRRLILL